MTDERAYEVTDPQGRTGVTRQPGAFRDQFGKVRPGFKARAVEGHELGSLFLITKYLD